jgi:hypothetical protein
VFFVRQEGKQLREFSRHGCLRLKVTKSNQFVPQNEGQRNAQPKRLAAGSQAGISYRSTARYSVGTPTPISFAIARQETPADRRDRILRQST